jgi:TRAP transporter 4TM/12TM fusion protein
MIPRRCLKGVEVCLSLFIPLVGLVAILDVPFHLTGASIFTQQYLALFWGLICSLLFIAFPARKRTGRETVPLYDLLLSAFSALAGLYVTLYYPKILLTLGIMDPWRVGLGVVVVFLVLESTRRLEGWALTIIIACFIAYALFGNYFPGILNSRSVPWRRLAIQLFLGADSLFGTPLKMAVMVVFAYVLFGLFLGSSGGSEFFVGIANSIFGRQRGGAAKASVVASMLLGGFSASAVGNVATIGVVTIPMMKKAGYPRTFAAAVEAVSGTGDLIVPPIMGTAAFIMPEFLGVPYGTVALAALVPGILYYLGDFLQIDFRAAKLGLKPLAPGDIPSLRSVMAKGWFFLVPIGLLIYTIFVLFLRPELAALIALMGLLVVLLFDKEKRGVLRPSVMVRIIQTTTKMMFEITVVCAAAGFIVGLVTYTGLGYSLSLFLTQTSGGSLLILSILTAIASTILGMGMPVTPCYILLATVAAPAIVNLGVSPLLAHLFVYYFGTFSFLTPPVCLAVYTSASIAEAPVMKSAFQAMKLAIAGYLVPFFFLYKPGLALAGTAWEIAVSVAEGIVATVFISMAIEGFFRRSLNLFERSGLLIAGFLLFAPGWTTTLIVLILAPPLIYLNWYKTKSPSLNPRGNMIEMAPDTRRSEKAATSFTESKTKEKSHED